LKIQLDEFRTEITAIKYLPNQDWFVVGNRNGELYFYDAIDGSLVYQALNEHANNVNCLEISPNGMIMVSGGRDKTVNIWKLDELKKKLKDLGPVEEKYAPIQFVETESIRDVDFVNNDWILVVSSSEGLSNNQSGDVSLLPLDFDVTGRELKKLVE
jgi:WD40 repeat protein